MFKIESIPEYVPYMFHVTRGDFALHFFFSIDKKGKTTAQGSTAKQF